MIFLQLGQFQHCFGPLLITNLLSIRNRLCGVVPTRAKGQCSRMDGLRFHSFIICFQLQSLQVYVFDPSQLTSFLLIFNEKSAIVLGYGFL